MGRTCSVFNCHRDRKKLGLRHLTVFGIPKKNNALELWSKAIGQTLSENDGVCELHFSNANILTESKMVLKDGTIHVIPYSKKMLAQNAIPETVFKELHIIDDARSHRQRKYRKASRF